MGTEGVEFTFKADQPQAGVFLRLLDGGRDHTDVVVQESRKREIDNLVYKYVGVSGVDRPRIVQVGYRTDSLLAELAFKNYLLAAGVAALLLATGGLGYFTLRRMVTVPLDQLIRAAKAVEAEEYEMGTLKEVRARGDELGRLASVFEDMVGKLATRYDVAGQLHALGRHQGRRRPRHHVRERLCDRAARVHQRRARGPAPGADRPAGVARAGAAAHRLAPGRGGAGQRDQPERDEVGRTDLGRVVEPGDQDRRRAREGTALRGQRHHRGDEAQETAGGPDRRAGEGEGGGACRASSSSARWSRRSPTP